MTPENPAASRASYGELWVGLACRCELVNRSTDDNQEDRGRGRKLCQYIDEALSDQDCFRQSSFDIVTKVHPLIISVWYAIGFSISFLSCMIATSQSPLVKLKKLLNLSQAKLWDDNPEQRG